MKQKVTTNDKSGSVCKIQVKAITFEELWDNYVTGSPYVDPKTGDPPPGFENQCAIRLSATLHKVGVDMKSFTKANVTVKSGRVFGRIRLNGLNTAVLADQMGSWLDKQPFCGLPMKSENITGSDWKSKVEGRTGIIMFDGYWSRSGESTPSGGHIDLWNGARLPVNSFWGAFATFGRRAGMNSFWPDLPFGYSDLGQSKTILFWEIK